MGVSPMELERAPAKRVMEWLYFNNEQANYETYQAESAAWRAEHARKRVN